MNVKRGTLRFIADLEHDITADYKKILGFFGFI